MRLLKFNEANLSLQKDLSRAQAAATSASASASKTSTSARGAQTGGGGRRKEGGRGTKRGRDDDDGARRPEMRLVVPDTLKVLLVDDWEAVTKNNQVRVSLQPSPPPTISHRSLLQPFLSHHFRRASFFFSRRQLVTLPRSPTIAEILEEFKQHVHDNPPPKYGLLPLRLSEPFHLRAFSFTPASVTRKWSFRLLYQACRCTLIRRWDPTCFTASSGRSMRKYASDM